MEDAGGDVLISRTGYRVVGQAQLNFLVSFLPSLIQSGCLSSGFYKTSWLRPGLLEGSGIAERNSRSKIRQMPAQRMSNLHREVASKLWFSTAQCLMNAALPKECWKWQVKFCWLDKVRSSSCGSTILARAPPLILCHLSSVTWHRAHFATAVWQPIIIVTPTSILRSNLDRTTEINMLP